MKKKYFTVEEDAVLREMYGKDPLASIGERLSRSPYSVGLRARRLGLGVKSLTCPNCGREFAPRFQRWQRFCSKKCRNQKEYRENPQGRREAERNRSAALPRKMAHISVEKSREMWDAFKAGRKNLNEFAQTTGVSTRTLSAFFRFHFPSEYADEMERRYEKSSKYARGRSFEYRVRDILKAKGYWVLRSPGSRGPMDLVAIRAGEVLLVQCKISRGCFGKADREKLIELAISIGARAALASRDRLRLNCPVMIEEVFGGETSCNARPAAAAEAR